MANNYPMYAAGVSFQKADESNNKHFYSAQVVVDPSDDSMSAKLTKDGEVISELPDGGGSSDFTVVTVLLSASGFGSLPIIHVSNTGMSSSALFTETQINAVLYRGEQVIDTYDISGTITVSDNAVYDSENNLITITGNCTITIS